MAFLVDALARNPEAPALEYGRKTRSYRVLLEDAVAIAGRLFTLGLRQGEVVAIRGGVSVEVVQALHGIWLAGGVAAVLPPRATPREEALALSSLAPSFLLLVGEQHPRGGSQVVGPREVRTVGWHRSGLVPALEAVEPSRVDPFHASYPEAASANALGRPAAMVLTSGTSGRRKAVSLSFGNLRASAAAVKERLDLRPGDRWLVSLSPAHVGGLALITRAALVGSCVVVRSSPRASCLAELIEEGSITHASLVPTMLHQLLDVWGDREVPKTLRCLLIGGAAAPEALLERSLGAGFPVALTYGLTEASSQVATASPESVRKDPRSVGSPLPGTEVRRASDGELLVRGDTVARAEADSEGWLHTGDLGEVDETGRIRLNGRLSDRIITGGENVDPHEVEAFLRAVPGVEAAAVVGVPDEKWGERVVAAVVSNRDGNPTEDALRGLVRSAFSPAKRPRNFVFLDALPLNANGKVDRGALRRLFQPS